jgi:3-ketosteroid 9alpha-monooxygenase subunit A
VTEVDVFHRGRDAGDEADLGHQEGPALAQPTGVPADREELLVITINITPVEDGRTEIFATYWIDRVTGDLDDGSYQRRLDEAKLALPDDIAIWNNQIYLDPPVLATEEGSGFRRIRRWARQFYPGDSGGNAPTGSDDTRSPAIGKLETNAS